MTKYSYRLAKKKKKKKKESDVGGHLSVFALFAPVCHIRNDTIGRGVFSSLWLFFFFFFFFWLPSPLLH